MSANLLKPDAAAKYLGISKTSLCNLRLKTDDGPEFIKIGQRTYRYTRDALDRWIARSSAPEAVVITHEPIRELFSKLIEHEDPASKEQSNLEAPRGIEIKLGCNLAGVVVSIGTGPSSGDPLGRRQTVRHFDSCKEAVDALPSIATAFLREHHERCEAQRGTNRSGCEL